MDAFQTETVNQRLCSHIAGEAPEPPVSALPVERMTEQAMQYYMEMQWLLPEILRDAIEACGFAFAGLWLKGGVSRSTNTSVDAVSATDTGASPLTDSKQ